MTDSASQARNRPAHGHTEKHESIDLWMKSSDSAVVTSLSQIILWMRRSDSTVMPVEMFLPRRPMRNGVMDLVL